MPKESRVGVESRFGTVSIAKSESPEMQQLL